MPTLVLNVLSTAYPSITNRLRASVYLQSSPQAFVASIIDSTVGHPSRWWSFPGLPRNNYGYILEEIDGSGTSVNTLAQFDVVPGERDGALTRDHEQIQVDSTNGINSGTNTFTFDGSETAVGSGLFKPDYRNWNITFDEIAGRGVLIEGQDYSWSKSDGVFTLLTPGDNFQPGTWYNINFDPQTETSGNSYPTITDFTIRLVTATGNILATDFANKIIVEPSGTYIELQLPDINTIVEGRKLMVEISANHDCCVKFLKYNTDIIKFGDGNLFAKPGECFSIYPFSRSGVKEWRVCDVFGNFGKVGSLVSFDTKTVDNAQELDGTELDILQDARLYNYVLNLPISRVSSYDTWGSTTSTMCLFSLASPSGKFHVPDRRNLFERNSTDTQLAGFYHTDTVIFHKHKESIGQLPQPPFGNDKIKQSGNGQYWRVQENIPDYTSNPIDDNGVAVGDSETQPKNYRINKFVLK